MRNQVLSIEQCKELIRLGIDMSNASAMWIADLDLDYNPVSWKVFFRKDDKTIEYWKEKFPLTYKEGNIYYTFTLQDILEMLPSYKTTYDKYTKCIDRYEITVDIPEGQHYITHIAQSSESLLDAAFKMLKWCKENKYI